MKRKFFLWVVVLGVVMAGVLAACEGNQQEGLSRAQPSPTGMPIPPSLGGEEPSPSAQLSSTAMPPQPSTGGKETPIPSSSPSPSPAPRSESTPASDGATLLQERCTVCHTLERVESAHKSAEEWEQTVSRMIGRGAKLTAEEKTVLLEYLATHYR